MKAVVMAGGFGTRIQPLTNSYPKPMLPVANKPMMQDVIERVRDVGVKDIIILLYFKPDIVKNYFGDGKKLGVNITYVLPDDDYGTAGAVKKAQKYLDETFFIVSGDLVTDFDFQKIVDFHEKKKSKLTITLTSVENPLQFGVVITDPKSKIQKFLEKPSWGEVFSDTINTGIYILEPEILNYIPENENYDFGKQLFPNLMKEGIDLWGCTVDGHWRDVGNPESYRDAHREILAGQVKVPLVGKKHEFDNGVAYLGKGTKLPKEITIEGTVVIGDNVTIQKDCRLKNCVIGSRTEIGKKCELEECTIWEDVEIKENCILHSAVICNNNLLEKKVTAKSGVIMAEKCEIGKLTSIEKDIIIWPEKIIEEASVISNNIIWGSKYKNSIFESGKVIGRTNLELSCEMATKMAEAFGSLLPVGSKVYVSRDYHKSSRMIKRAFLGGLLSTGINVQDVHILPSNVMRNKLAQDEDVIAGVHVRQSIEDAINTEILFFTSEGLNIDTNTEKSCERIFFRESFRRVNHEEIGEITENLDEELKEAYKKSFLEHLDKDIFKQSEPKMVADLLFGSTSNIYPDIVNALGIDNIMINAYLDDKKLSKLPSFVKNAEHSLSKVVTGLELDAGFIIFPNGQRMHIITDKGEILEDHMALMLILSLLNLEEKELRVFLPVYSPDILDKQLGNIQIERGKFTNFTAKQLRQYDFVGSNTGNFSFTDFALNMDTMFASLKVMELLNKHDKKISEILSTFPKFYFKAERVNCPSTLKGKMMRKFMEDSKGKEASHLDGVKIWESDNSWVLMLPHPNADCVNLYIQSGTKKEGEAILKSYSKKIIDWQKED